MLECPGFKYLLLCFNARFVIYLSTLCDNADQGKEALQAAMSSLLVLPRESSKHGTPEVNEDIIVETKPDLLWSALYVHDLTEVCFSFQLYFLAFNCRRIYSLARVSCQ